MSDDVFQDDTQDDIEEVEVRFHYPDGLIQWHQLSARETVVDLLSVARALRSEIPMGDILWRDRSLTSVSKFDEKLVSCLGVDSTAQFNVLRRAPTLSISVRTDTGASQRQTLKLDHEETWHDVRDMVPYLFRPAVTLKEIGAVYTQHLEYDDRGSEGKGIACYDPMEDKFNFNDAEYCYPIARRDWVRITRRYLRPTSPLPSSQDNLPHVIVDNDTEFLKLVPERSMEEVIPEALSNTLFVAFIEGVRADSKIFWKLRGDLYLDPESQELFASRWEVPGDVAQNHVILLMRRTSRPPYIPVPDGCFLEVFNRVGLRLKMDAEGRVAASSSAEAFPDVEHWEVFYEVDKFTEDFTRFASEGCGVRLPSPTFTSSRSSPDSGLSITSLNRSASFDCMLEIGP